MLKQTVTLINKLGLHARASMLLVNHASRFQSEILLHYGDRAINAKSVMAVMVLALSQGTELEISVSGEDEQDAINNIVALVNDRFGEEE